MFSLMLICYDRYVELGGGGTSTNIYVRMSFTGVSYRILLHEAVYIATEHFDLFS